MSRPPGRLLRALAAAALLAAASAAHAACFVNPPALAFGLYDGMSATPATTAEKHLP